MSDIVRHTPFAHICKRREDQLVFSPYLSLVTCDFSSKCYFLERVSVAQELLWELMVTVLPPLVEERVNGSLL